MNTLETKLTIDHNENSFPSASFIFKTSNRTVLRIMPDGRMIIGDALSKEEATQEVAKLLVAAFDEQIQEMVDNRIAAIMEASK